MIICFIKLKQYEGIDFAFSALTQFSSRPAVIHCNLWHQEACFVKVAPCCWKCRTLYMDLRSHQRESTQHKIHTLCTTQLLHIRRCICSLKCILNYVEIFTYTMSTKKLAKRFCYNFKIVHKFPYSSAY